MPRQQTDPVGGNDRTVEHRWPRHSGPGPGSDDARAGPATAGDPERQGAPRR